MNCRPGLPDREMRPEPEESLRPKLIVIAGPNGTGKTTLTERALGHEWLEGCEYLNPDSIAKDLYGDWNDPRAVLAAAKHATEQRELCLAQHRSLAFETVFSTEEKVGFVRRAIAAGYFVRIFFVGTDGPTINASRVAERVLQGGHDVPIPKIIARYYRSVANLARVVPFVNRSYVYDNSIDRALPALLFRTVDGTIQKVYETGHAWAERVLDSVALSHESANRRTPTSRGSCVGRARAHRCRMSLPIKELRTVLLRRDCGTVGQRWTIY